MSYGMQHMVHIIGYAVYSTQYRVSTIWHIGRSEVRTRLDRTQDTLWTCAYSHVEERGGRAQFTSRRCSGYGPTSNKCYTILYYDMIYHTILYYTILHYTTLYYTILHYTTLYYTILYYTILYYTILYYTILYYTILYYTSKYRRGPHGGRHGGRRDLQAPEPPHHHGRGRGCPTDRRRSLKLVNRKFEA